MLGTRFLRFGVDQLTNTFLRQVLLHPLASGYRLLRFLNQDEERMQRHLLRNLALGLPGREAEMFQQEIDNLKDFSADDYPLFPYPFSNIEPCVIKSGFDKGKGLPYVIHNNRRFFGRKDQTVEEIERSYRYFVDEEGLLGTGRRIKSPHSYVDTTFRVEPGDIVVDIGCSDALFAFDNAEKAKRIYLFESWNRWRPALNASFEPFMGKTRVYSRFVSDRTTRKEIKLCDAINESSSDCYFIKMDIEGGERAVIQSSAEFLRANKVKLSCCVYHRQDDAKVISEILKELGFSFRYSQGYMLPLCGDMLFPYFRHGVIYAQNF